MRAAVDALDPELIICPFLRERVPDDVWQSRPTVIVHPGPVGDRGPSSLDWAISRGRAEWGVTALSAVAEMDAGPVWASRSFALPAEPPRKSALYTGPVTDAAVELVREVVEKASRPGVHARSGRRDPRSRPPAPRHDPGGPPLLVDRPDGAHPAPHPRRRRRSGRPHRACRDGGVGLRRARAGTSDGARGGATGLDRAPPPRSGAGAHRRRRGLDRAGPAGPRHARPAREAAGRHRCWATASRDVPEALDPVADATGAAGDHLPADGRRRRGHLRLLQRGGVDGPVPPARLRAALGRGPGHARAPAAGRRDLLQRHPPGRHRGAPRTPRPRPGATSTPSTTSAGRSSPARASSWWPRWAATRARAG